MMARASRDDPFDQDCPSRMALNHVASRWGILIICSLRGGPRRFSELRGQVGGISEKMLSQNLRQLAADGLVEREVVPTSPPQVSYELTELGQELSVHIQGLVDWVIRRSDRIVAAQARSAAQ
ncbi:winged helix-turn-helix transcriptional regulator [Microlunatus speluncae]|uniref:winged helix-turn-helix transcriptional regulator n=1 Tax=Microlunatus speluncae TaxID=2594267 RepID=UPI0012664E17|nr:helix-turn-helix domain-containing protein [Microlunatus speluncae]